MPMLVPVVRTVRTFASLNVFHIRTSSLHWPVFGTLFSGLPRNMFFLIIDQLSVRGFLLLCGFLAGSAGFRELQNLQRFALPLLLYLVATNHQHCSMEGG